MMARSNKSDRANGKPLATRQSVDQAVKTICDIMRRGNVTSAVQYVPELTWILFLRVLDEIEQTDQANSALLGVSFRPSLTAPYRWCDWGAPGGAKRTELEQASQGSFFRFVNEDLIPYLKTLEEQPGATIRQKLISEIMRGVQRTRIDTERNFRDVLDKVDALSKDRIDQTHVFTLSQVYEGLLLKMGEKNNDGGQFFTPRVVTRIVIEVLAPRIGETVYDPGCGTGGFLAEAYQFIERTLEATNGNPDDYEQLKEQTFYGREKESLIYPVALANLVLHGIDHPHLWLGNTLTGQKVFDGLFQGAPRTFKVVATNPPFGGKEGVEAQIGFDYKTSSTQVLFLQHVMSAMDPKGGRCGIVVDEGLLFRTNEDAFVKTKRKLLEEFDLWCVVSLPGGVFTQAGAGVKTNLLFFHRGAPTERIWYYDLSDLKVSKTRPLTRDAFEHRCVPRMDAEGTAVLDEEGRAVEDDWGFLRLLPDRAESPFSWTLNLAVRRDQLKADAQPYLDQAQAKRQEAAVPGNRLLKLKELPRKEQDATAIAEAEARFQALTREARQLEAKAEDITNQLYDLKAVNPNRSTEGDTRTPEELLNFIEQNGREIAAILVELRRPVQRDTLAEAGADSAGDLSA
jgi:type I restriction enzyme M protein